MFKRIHQYYLRQIHLVQIFHSITSRSIFILFFHLRLGLPSFYFLSGFPSKLLKAFSFLPSPNTRLVCLILIDFIIPIIF